MKNPLETLQEKYTALLNFYLFIIFLFFFSCTGDAQKAENIEVLNTVWETINIEFYDENFNGVDWEDQYNKYKPIIRACKSDDSLYYYLNQMLFSLNVSHCGVVSAKEADESGDPQLFMDGFLGIDIRIIDNLAIVTSINDKSKIRKAGINLGTQILEINDCSVGHFIKERDRNRTPPFNERNFRSLLTQDIVREFYGVPQDTVKLKFRNSDNSMVQKKLIIQNRNMEKSKVIDEMPALYAGINNKLINLEIAYIKIDAFLPQILDTTITTIEKYRKVPNLIIDLRGNPGGVFEVRKSIAEQFIEKRTLFWKYHRRGIIDEVYLSPSTNPYKGNLVILIDELSASSSEEFAGGMKAINRATIIGKQSPGKVLTMEVLSLPEGAFLIYPNQQTKTCVDDVLEGIGVIPHYEVELNRSDLIKGFDTQLEAAIKFLIQDQNF